MKQIDDEYKLKEFMDKKMISTCLKGNKVIRKASQIMIFFLKTKFANLIKIVKNI